MVFNKLVLYNDPAQSEKHYNLLVNNLQLSEQNIELMDCLMLNAGAFANTENLLIYLMGAQDIPVDLADRVIHIGPAFKDLYPGSPAFKTLEQDLKPGPNNIFDKHSKKEQSHAETPAVSKTSSPQGPTGSPRIPKIPNLLESVDDAISGLTYLKESKTQVYLPELNTWISVKPYEDSITYDELLGVLLFFKRFGSTKFTWQGEEVKVVDDGD